MGSRADSIFANQQTIENYDAELWRALNQESTRQEEHIELIASENYASQRVMEAQGGVLTNKYAEGYPHKRYYGGCEYVDVAEEIAISRAKALFKADYANVQPHAGSSANAAAFLAMLEPNDKILGMSLDHGGHLTHGAKVNFSGKNYTAFQYGLNSETYEIDYDQVRDLAKKNNPKMIIGENVKGLLSRKTTNKENYIDVIISEFEKLNYIVDKRVMKCNKYGVPQKRERLIIIGIKRENPYNWDVVFPEEEKAEPNSPDLKYYEAKKGPNTGWKNGPTIEVLNISEESITVSFSKDGSTSWLTPPGSGTVASGEKRNFICKKRGGWNKGDKKGNLTVKSGAESVVFSAGYRGDKNSKKIVCAELYHQGWIPYEIFRADEDWGDAMFLKDPRLIVGYQMWSKHIVNFMRKYPQYTGLVYYGMSKYWCHWMAHQMGVVKTNNLLGQAIHWVGKHLSYYVYDNYGGERIYRFLLKKVLVESFDEFKSHLKE